MTKRLPLPTPSDMATIRLHWQLGDWPSIHELPYSTSELSDPDDNMIEILCYKVQAAFQCGEHETGNALVSALRAAGVSRSTLAACLMSGCLTSIARGRLFLGQTKTAQSHLEAAAELNPHGGNPALIAKLRIDETRRQLWAEGRPLPRGDTRRKKLFIDCGGHDGCSAIQFLLSHPDFDSISFEPNPQLWPHYKDIPTELIGKAAYTYDGDIDFTLDPVDADGSSIMAEKPVDAKNTVRNEDCEVLRVPCVDLSAFVDGQASQYEKIVLKLDVEGAEYDILEKMLADGTLRHLSQLYIEFHAHKMNMDPARHDAIVSEVSQVVPIEEWDALPFSIISADGHKQRNSLRKRLIQAITHNQTHFPESF